MSIVCLYWSINQCNPCLEVENTRVLTEKINFSFVPIFDSYSSKSFQCFEYSLPSISILSVYKNNESNMINNHSCP